MTTTLLFLAILLGFYVAWTIGANDVANSVGTAVGSGALTLGQAVVIAAIFEFTGAFLLGSHVSETVESGILGYDILAYNRTDYLVGMFAALLASGFWLQFASFFGWPVSTTHTIVGAVVGFGLAAGGFGAIIWTKIFSIIASWVISPLLGGAVAFVIFTAIRRHILYELHPIRAAKRVVPWIAFAIFFSQTTIIFFNGLHGFELILPFGWLMVGSLIIGLIAALIAHLLIRGLAEETEGFEEVERIFMSLQVIIACFMAFAHGSNDVANVIGPLSGIINVLQGKDVIGRSVPPWLLVLGGGGIVVGLATWGWRVIETIGKKITQLTPSRGFSAGFGATLTVMLASKLGLPISTTHVLVGAVLGVGFARGINAINLNTVRDIGVSWIVTVPVGAILSVLFFYIIRLFV